MIRVRFRTIHIPQGDTGFIVIPNLVPYEEGSTVAILFVYDKEQRKTVLKKEVPADDKDITFYFQKEDTENLIAKAYFWDVKIYKRPTYDENGEISGADQIDSVYNAFDLPEFIVEGIGTSEKLGARNRRNTRDYSMDDPTTPISSPIAGLSANGFIIQRSTFDDFPKNGHENGLYIEGTTGKVYYWKGDVYQQIKISSDDISLDGATIAIKTKISSDWEAENPILVKGEIGYIADLNLFKIGDGIQPFNDLPFLQADAYDVPEWAKQKTPNFEIENINGLTEEIEQMSSRIDDLEKNSIEKIEYADGTIEELDDKNVLSLRAATNDLYGTVKGSEKENGISIKNGEMEVYTLSADRLVQAENNVIRLSCGSSIEIL